MIFANVTPLKFNLVVVKLTFPPTRTWEKKVGWWIRLEAPKSTCVFLQQKFSAAKFLGEKTTTFPRKNTHETPGDSNPAVTNDPG